MPLSSMTRLQYLDLGWCLALRDSRALSSLTDLQHLDLTDCDNALGVQHFLCALKDLQYLSLGSQFAGLQDLRPLSSLRYGHRGSAGLQARVNSLIQFVSHVLPPSAEAACSQRAERGVIRDHDTRV
jgi:hypothetical protein